MTVANHVIALCQQPFDSQPSDSVYFVSQELKEHDTNLSSYACIVCMEDTLMLGIKLMTSIVKLKSSVCTERPEQIILYSAMVK